MLRTENSTEGSRSSQSARHDSCHGFFLTVWYLVQDPPWPPGHRVELSKTGDIEIHSGGLHLLSILIVTLTTLRRCNRQFGGLSYS